MTPEQIKLVQSSFGRVYPVKSALSTAFYDRLFEIAPQVREMFPEDMKHQREKLSDTLAFVVKNLGNPDHLMIAVSGLARRHVGYGAVSAQLEPVGAALIYALQQKAPGGLSQDEQEAWVAAYSVIVDAMTPIMDAREAESQ